MLNRDSPYNLRRSPLAGHAFGVAATAVALAIRFALQDEFPPGFPFVTFFPAVILSTFVGGLWPGVTAGVFSGLAALYFFMEPYNAFKFNPGTELAMAFYTLVVGVDIALIHYMVRGHEHLEAERERSNALFTEMQHRISNNLQAISSLLAIQQAKVTDAEAIRALADASKRVATLGRLHRRLHHPDRMEPDAAQFLTELCADVLSVQGGDAVTYRVEADPATIPAHRLVPLALVVTELVSNSLEHGFANGTRPGTIAVTYRRRSGNLCLAVSDSGAGLPPGFDAAASTSLGLQIVRLLAAQLGGRFTLETNGGTVGRVEFAE